MTLFKWLYDQILGDVPHEPAVGLVVVATPQGEGLGGFLQSKLQDQGIHSMLRNVSPLYPEYSTSTSMLELRVRYADLERAREILGIVPEDESARTQFRRRVAHRR